MSTGYIRNMEVARATAAAARWRLAFDMVVRKTSTVSFVLVRMFWGGGGIGTAFG